MTTTHLTAAADQLAAELRNRRAYDHGEERCDALAPCPSCAAGRLGVQVRRRLASVPEQRTAVEA